MKRRVRPQEQHFLYHSPQSIECCANQIPWDVGGRAPLFLIWRFPRALLLLVRFPVLALYLVDAPLHCIFWALLGLWACLAINRSFLSSLTAPACRAETLTIPVSKVWSEDPGDSRPLSQEAPPDHHRFLDAIKNEICRFCSHSLFLYAQWSYPETTGKVSAWWGPKESRRILPGSLAEKQLAQKKNKDAHHFHENGYFVLFCFGQHLQYSGLISGSVLRDLSCEGLGDHIRCWGIKPRLEHARQEPSLLTIGPKHALLE